MTFTVKDLNDWYENLEGSGSPEDILPYNLDTKEFEIPKEFLPFEWSVDEGLDPDDRGVYYFICKFGDRFFKIDGRYDSWAGTDWYGDEEWYEVEKKTRLQEYWGEL